MIRKMVLGMAILQFKRAVFNDLMPVKKRVVVLLDKFPYAMTGIKST